MDLEAAARSLALSRVGYGAAMAVAPSLVARVWIGGAGARDPRAQTLARALGARDLALGAGALVALRTGGGSQARGWFSAQALSDTTDLLATLIAGRALPALPRAFTALAAAGSAAVAAGYAARG